MSNEMRLVDANALMDDVEMDGALYACLGCVEDVRFLVDSQPTVDAVEVVRCKDCKFTEGRSKYGWLWCGKWNDARDDYGYCYRGERRTDETKTD